MKFDRFPASNCLNCGRKLDAATAVKNEEAPQPGNVSLCVGCSHIMIFTEDLGLLEAVTANAAMPLVAGEDVRTPVGVFRVVFGMGHFKYHVRRI
jgi:hypothetical protein